MSRLKELLALRDQLRFTLVTATERRELRTDLVTDPYHGTDVPEWVLYERGRMRDHVNRVRRARGVVEVDAADIARAEAGAEGHADYGDKFAWECARLAMADAEPEEVPFTLVSAVRHLVERVEDSSGDYTPEEARAVRYAKEWLADQKWKAGCP